MKTIDKEFALQCRLITSGMQGLFLESLQEFAELVRADERERLLQAVEEMRPVQDNPLLQNKPPEFWIRSFKQAIEARGNS